MPAKPKARVSTKAVTTKAKRQAIVKAYGFHRAEDLMDDFYYTRRHLAKLDQANPDGWHELRYQDEAAELADIIERTLKIIRERDGVKYYKEVAAGLIAVIESNVECQAMMDRDMIRRAVS
jgi:hypothetical protein